MSGPSLRLADTLDRLLHRVLDGDDVSAAAVRLDEVTQAGIDRGRLSAAARAREEDGAGPFSQFRLEGFEDIFGYSQLIQVQGLSGGVEDAHHDLLTVDRGKATHAHLDAAS